MIPPKFEYVAPTSVAEAAKFLAAHPDDAKLIAGGQSLVPVLKLRLAKPGYLVDLGRIAGLSYIREDAGKIAIGGMTTYADIKSSALLREKCPLLTETATVIADVQVRNRGTIGGSLSHADPSADMPAPILALDAELKVVGPKGERLIAVKDYFQGMFATALAPDEILTEIRVPVLTGQRSAYLKAARRATDFALVGVAVRMRVGKGDVCEEIAIGITGVGEKAYRASAVERALQGKRLEAKAIEQAAAGAVDGVTPLGNIHGSVEYRTNLAKVYVARAIAAAK
ncbi:MAG: xanthine dehydrogenase family protein subunit M [Betaproteobacteria bacterium]|nr:xanthine dehydrogenase family protein subunit M [Betaproteobacteria bacterium]